MGVEPGRSQTPPPVHDGSRRFCFLALAGFACTSSAPSIGSNESTVLRVGVPESNVSGEELGVGQFGNLLNFESLTLTGADGRAMPRLAQRWRWEDDGLTLRIELRPSVFLHDDRRFAGQTAVDLITQALTRSRKRRTVPLAGRHTTRLPPVTSKF